MTTEQKLAQYGISMDLAYQIVMTNVMEEQLGAIYGYAQLLGFTNTDIANIMNSNTFWGTSNYTGSQIAEYFNSVGLDGVSLGFNEGSVTNEEAAQYMMTYLLSDNYEAIYKYAQENGFTNSDIADIMNSVSFMGSNTNYTGSQFAQAFNENGLDGLSLGFTAGSVSTEEAYQYMMQYLLSDNWEAIYNYAIANGFSVSDLAEILNNGNPFGSTGNTYSGSQLADYFNQNGFDISKLGVTGNVDNIQDGLYSGNVYGTVGTSDFEGRFYIYLTEDEIEGGWSSMDYSHEGEFTGSINSQTGEMIAASQDNLITFIGQVSNDNVNGTWTVSNIANGTFNADFYG